MKINPNWVRLWRWRRSCSLLTVNWLMAVGVATSHGATLSNSTPINFPVGAATAPYPSVVSVSGLSSTITSVSVTLVNVTHSFPDDLDVLLVGPGGQTVLLMSDTGGAHAVSQVNLSFSDTAAAVLPDATQIAGGSYRPSNYGAGDVFPAPAPAAPYGAALSVFAGTAPNGAWRLYVRDDSSLNNGSIAGGWQLNLQLAQPPVITTPPQSQTVAPGSDVTFSVAVSGTPPFGYQWLRNGKVLVPFGQGAASLKIANVQAAHAGIYAVVVTNSAHRFPGVTSPGAVLQVLGPLIVVEPPVSQIVKPGDSAAFQVIAAGDPPLSYQWQLNGAILPGQTNSTLTFSDLQVTAGGSFSVVVLNGSGAIVAEPALLVVSNPTGPAPTDQFSDRHRLSDPQGILQDNSALSGVELGEPVAPGGGRTVWYEWVAFDDGIVTLTTQGSAFDTLLRVFTGNVLSNLTLVAKDDDSGGYYTSRLQFNARRGTRYQIMLDGFDYAGTGGEFTLSWSLEETRDLVPVILAPPEPRTVLEGSSVEFRVLADSPDVTYQWFFDGVALRGATSNLYTIMQASPAHVGFYAVRLSNEGRRFVQSAPVDLQIGSTPDAMMHDKLQLVSLPAANGNRPAGGFISIGLGVTDHLSAPITNSTASFTPCNHPFSNKYRYRGLHATNDGVIHVDTAGSQILARLAVYRDPISLNPNELACDTISGPDMNPARVLFNATNGFKYMVVVEAYQATGDIELTSKMGIAPTILALPQCLFVAHGANLLLQMPATNWCPLPDCQWRFNGQNIAGATNTTLLLTSFNASLAGNYSVVMSNFVRVATNTVASVAQAGAPVLQYVLQTNSTSLAFVVRGSADQPFVLETTANLATAWLPVRTNQDPCLPLVFTNTPLDTKRFFRAVLWPGPGPGP